MMLKSKGTWLAQKAAFLLFITGLALSSCTHEGNLPTNPNPNPQDTSGNGGGNNGGNNDTNQACHPDTVYFVRDIQPFLNTTCAYSGCHDAATASDGVILNNYQNVINTADVRPFSPPKSDLYEVLVETDINKRMPYQEPALPPEKIDMIRKWINQGALNNTCDDCDTTNITYSLVIQGLVQTNCLNCHSSATDIGGRDFSTYEKFKTAVQNTNLLDRINNRNGANVMPQGGQMPACAIRKIEIWTAQNFPQ